MVDTVGEARKEKWLEAAYQAGVESAEKCASCVDEMFGYDHAKARRALRELRRDGFTRADDVTALPQWPDLSGEWADSLTPRRLFEEVTGGLDEAEVDPDGDLLDALCTAWGRGVEGKFPQFVEQNLEEILKRG